MTDISKKSFRILWKLIYGGWNANREYPLQKFETKIKAIRRLLERLAVFTYSPDCRKIKGNLATAEGTDDKPIVKLNSSISVLAADLPYIMHNTA